MKLATRVANRLISGFGLRIVEQPRKMGNVPSEACTRLRKDSAELSALSAAYVRCDAAVTNGYQWNSRTVSSHDLLYFRGDTAYVWQREPDASYALTARYAYSTIGLDVLKDLKEDDLFGARTVEIDGRLVSRDLLDSILEMDFLNRHGVSPNSVLDIGAGYGRLAHRMTTAYPGIRYVCADAVPVSTFLSRYYLEFRRSTAKVVALHDFIPEVVDLTVNIHSFTECTEQAVKWWLSRVRTTHLMIVPNAMNHGGTRIINRLGHDLMPIFAECGFELIASEPKYSDATVQQYGIQPTWYYLFATRSKGSHI